MALAFKELKKFVEADNEAEASLRKFALTLACPHFERLGWTIKNNETESDTKLRSLIIGLMLYGEDSTVEKHCLELFSGGIESIDPELRHLVIGSVVKQSSNDSIIKSLLTQYQSTHSADLRDDICAGLTSARHPAHIQLLLEAMTDNDVIRRQDVFRWFAYLIRSRYAREATWQWMVTNWSWIEENFAGDKSYDYFPQYAASGLMTHDHLENYKTFFEPKRNIPALTRTINIGIKEIEGKLIILKGDSEAVQAKLRELK